MLTVVKIQNNIHDFNLCCCFHNLKSGTENTYGSKVRSIDATVTYS